MDYLYIRAWGEFQKLPANIIRTEIELAHEEKAPTNVTYKRTDGTWATIENFRGIDRETIERIAGRIQQANPPETRTII